MNCLICGQQHDTTICPDKPIPVSPNLFCPGCGYALNGWLPPDPRVAALAKAAEETLVWLGSINPACVERLRAALVAAKEEVDER